MFRGAHLKPDSPYKITIMNKYLTEYKGFRIESFPHGEYVELTIRPFEYMLFKTIRAAKLYITKHLA